MNRRALLTGMATTVATTIALGGCLRPEYRTALLDETGTGSVGAAYSLAAGDKLRVIVFGQDNLSNIYAVDGAGRIALPLIGPVKVAGGSTAQAARAIEARLRDGYVREPHVTVEVEVYRPFFILGEVTTSGQYPYVSGMTVETAVAIAAASGPAPPATTPSSPARGRRPRLGHRADDLPGPPRRHDRRQGALVLSVPPADLLPSARRRSRSWRAVPRASTSTETSTDLG